MSVAGRRPPEDPVGRGGEIARIVECVAGPGTGAGCAVVGRRMMGKSVILAAAKRILDWDGGVITGHVDLRAGFRRRADAHAGALIINLASSYHRATSESRAGVFREARRLCKGFAGGPDDGDYGADAGTGAGPLSVAFEYAGELSRRSGKRVVVMIDGFEHVMSYGGMRVLEEVLDTLRRGRDGAGVSFVVCGSSIRRLADVLGGGAGPLSDRFEVVDVGPLKRSDAIELFCKSCTGLAGRGAVAAAAACDAFDLVGGHPYYTVMLAEGMRGDEPVCDTYARLCTSTTGAINLYVSYVLAEDLGPGYRDAGYPAVLAALAWAELLPKSPIPWHEGRLPRAELPGMLETLVKRGLVARSGRNHVIRDRVMRDYFCQLDVP